ncbi:hypothetical protein C3E89_01160 [Clostridium sp. Cult1]|nr:hypothetical protein [Clostridium sp. Cult1]
MKIEGSKFNFIFCEVEFKLLVRSISIEDIEICARIFIDAYSKEPWNESYDLEKVKKFLTKFTSSNIYIGWVILEKGQIVGFIVGVIMPYLERDYFRIEDICVRPDMQRKGIGGEFLKRIAFELRNKNIDSIILNTIKDFPTYKFYLINGFIEIESSSTMFLEI